jgi:hypothetical protein
LVCYVWTVWLERVSAACFDLSQGVVGTWIGSCCRPFHFPFWLVKAHATRFFCYLVLRSYAGSLNGACVVCAFAFL